MNDRVLQIIVSAVYNSFRGTGIFPLNIENVHLKRCIAVDDDSESAINSVAQVTFESFENPSLSNAASPINNDLLVPAQGIISGLSIN